MDQYRIKTDVLDDECPDDLKTLKDTSHVPPLDSIIGQQRAVQAIAFGLSMTGLEYNVFVTGLEGTGKSTIVRKLLEAHAAEIDPPGDLCMVNNFENEYTPLVIEMPKGSAVYFSRSMSTFIENLKIRIKEYLKTPDFRNEQEKIRTRYAEMQKELFDSLQKEAAKYNLGVFGTENGYEVMPMADGKAMNAEAFEKLDEKSLQAMEQATGQIEAMLNETLFKINSFTESQKAEIKTLASAQTESLILEQLDPIRYYFRECSDIQTYLNRVKEDIIENLALFLGMKGSPEEEHEQVAMMAASLVKRYQVNVLVDRRSETGAPVIYEPHPNFGNLFGKIEKKPVMGSFTTDFTMVQAGSLLKANNGFIILNIEPLLQNPALWETLKRTLLHSKLQIADMPDQADYGMPSLKPAPIPICVKVILIGGYEPFRALQAMDGNFNKIFKVRADFDYEIEKNQDTIFFYTRFIADVCRKENLMAFTGNAVWQVVRYGSRLVDDRGKLSLQFGKIRALLKEADYWARKDSAARNVQSVHVNKAVQQYRQRHNLYEEKVLEQFDDSSVLMDVKGATVGQVNALAVYDMGEIAFGRPTRITAESYMGKPGLINVEHESDLSGETHDKGLMIISGYLGKIFAQQYPLSVTISITFEQSYDGVDGDSASSTELYAVLSSLSKIPIRQDIAVTGSVNQKGEIQAIGGVNEKIEGFFDICTRKGLTGTQGVMIPHSNVKNLILKPSVLKAVNEGRFHLYKVKTIEEGVAVLTGVSAGKPDKKGDYPAGTVFGEVQKTLLKYHKLCMQFSR